MFYTRAVGFPMHFCQTLRWSAGPKFVAGLFVRVSDVAAGFSTLVFVFWSPWLRA